MATSWQIGDRIQNRWEIYKILRGGGMGIVYIVYDHEFHQPYAAKTFRDDRFAENPSTANLFTKEALSWVKLDVHQNVTRAHFVLIIGAKQFGSSPSLRPSSKADHTRLQCAFADCVHCVTHRPSVG